MAVPPTLIPTEGLLSMTLPGRSGIVRVRLSVFVHSTVSAHTTSRR